MSTTNSLYNETKHTPIVDQTTNGSMTDVVNKILEIYRGNDSTRADATSITVRIKGHK